VRYAYRRIPVLLQREGGHVNVKGVHRLYSLDCLQNATHAATPACIKLRDDRSNATGPSRVWAMDWMHDELFDCRRLWVLTSTPPWSTETPKSLA
jgi:putative transposase